MTSPIQRCRSWPVLWVHRCRCKKETTKGRGEGSDGPQWCASWKILQWFYNITNIINYPISCAKEEKLWGDVDDIGWWYCFLATNWMGTIILSCPKLTMIGALVVPMPSAEVRWLHVSDGRNASSRYSEMEVLRAIDTHILGQIDSLIVVTYDRCLQFSYLACSADTIDTKLTGWKLPNRVDDKNFNPTIRPGGPGDIPCHMHSLHSYIPMIHMYYVDILYIIIAMQERHTVHVHLKSSWHGFKSSQVLLLRLVSLGSNRPGWVYELLKWYQLHKHGYLESNANAPNETNTASEKLVKAIRFGPMWDSRIKMIFSFQD